MLSEMIELARLRDRICFASQGTIARRTGLCRATVNRAQQRLERAGKIHRLDRRIGCAPRTIVWGFGPIRRTGVTQRTSCRTPKTLKTTTPFGCGTRERARGRRRRLMENNPAPTGQLRLVRASGEETPFNAGDAIAATVDAYGMPIPGQIRARLGKEAKALLEDGLAPEIVVAACTMAVRMARPHLVASLALEIQTAKAGAAVDWGEYRNAIRRLNVDNRPKTAIDAAFEKMRKGELR